MTEDETTETATETLIEAALETEIAVDADVIKRVADALQASEDSPAPAITLNRAASDTPLAARRR